MTNNDEYSEWTKQFNTTINKVAEITIETDDPSVVDKILTFIWDNDLRAMPKVKHFGTPKGDSMSKKTIGFKYTELKAENEELKQENKEQKIVINYLETKMSILMTKVIDYNLQNKRL